MATVDFEIEDDPNVNGTDEVPEKTPLSKADRKLADDLTAIYVAISMALDAVASIKDDPGLKQTAELLAAKSGAISEAWLELANTNPAVKRALKNLTAGTMVGGLALLHGICLVPLLADRGIVPPYIAIMAQAL